MPTAWPNAIAALLARIVSDMYCSSWGDDALLALGDMALERGEASIARSYWEQILERPPEWVPKAAFERRAGRRRQSIRSIARRLTEWYQADASTRRSRLPPAARRAPVGRDGPAFDRFWKAARLPTTHLAYPSSHAQSGRRPGAAGAGFDFRRLAGPGQKRARSLRRSRIPTPKEIWPAATSPMPRALERLLAEAESWPSPRTSEDWPTFAGNAARNKIAAEAIDVGAPLWPAIPLGEPLGGRRHECPTIRLVSRRRTERRTAELPSGGGGRNGPRFDRAADLCLQSAHRQTGLARQSPTAPRRNLSRRGARTARSTDRRAGWACHDSR